MADISIQFHALPEELLLFVRECMEEFGLHLVAMRFFPFEAVEVGPERLDEIFSGDSLFRELGFTTDPPVLPATSNLDFADRNPDKLRLNIQRVTADGLRQTGLTCRTEDKSCLKVWRKIARRLVARTAGGVVTTNPDSGISDEPCKSFRYTPGAKELADRGVVMLPSAGGCTMRFVDLST